MPLKMSSFCNRQAEQVTGEKASILTYTLLRCMNICISIERSKTNYFATIGSYIDFMALKKIIKFTWLGQPQITSFFKLYHNSKLRLKTSILLVSSELTARCVACFQSIQT